MDLHLSNSCLFSTTPHVGNSSVSSLAVLDDQGVLLGNVSMTDIQA